MSVNACDDGRRAVRDACIGSQREVTWLSWGATTRSGRLAQRGCDPRDDSVRPYFSFTNSTGNHHGCLLNWAKQRRRESPAHAQLTPVVKDHDIIAAEPRLHFPDAIDVHDRRLVNADEQRRIEPLHQ